MQVWQWQVLAPAASRCGRRERRRWRRRRAGEPAGPVAAAVASNGRDARTAQASQANSQGEAQGDIIRASQRTCALRTASSSSSCSTRCCRAPLSGAIVLLQTCLGPSNSSEHCAPATSCRDARARCGALIGQASRHPMPPARLAPPARARSPAHAAPLLDRLSASACPSWSMCLDHVSGCCLHHAAAAAPAVCVSRCCRRCWCIPQQTRESILSRPHLTVPQSFIAQNLPPTCASCCRLYRPAP